MNKLNQIILDEINLKNNLLLIGPTREGKTWYVLNELIPYLSSYGVPVVYFKDCNENFVIPDKTQVVIVDEVESFLDEEILVAHSDERGPYYPEEYRKKVKIWMEKLKTIQKPVIYILTRNNKRDIDNFIDNFDVMDWGTKVKCFHFVRSTNENTV